jgi:hypothetical protein
MNLTCHRNLRDGVKTYLETIDEKNRGSRAGEAAARF